MTGSTGRKSAPRRGDASRAARRGARAEIWGRAAEEAAARWYVARGGEVVAQRRRTAAGEVDLAVRFDDMLAVVEVKARRTMAAARAAPTPAKWRKLGMAAQLLAEEFGISDLRIDLAAVGGDGAVSVIENVGLAGAFDGG